MPLSPFNFNMSRSVSRSTGGSSMQTLLYLMGSFAVALVLGISSAQYMIETGSPLTTRRVGPWVSWVSEANSNADHYTKAHLARSGRFPLAGTMARYFIARTDSSGDELLSTCEYVVQGEGLNARWWSIALYDENGTLIDNPSQRFSFSSSEAIRRSDGTYRIHLAKNARPENWLPTGSGPERGLMLMLRAYSPRDTDAFGSGRFLDDQLPKIERLQCE